MLPASDNRNNDIRQLSRYGRVIEFITGTTHVSGDTVEPYFVALWKQCTELAVQESVELGTVNQGAGTFYNTICAHKNLKTALLSSTRVTVSIAATGATLSPGSNGIFFDAVRCNVRLQHPAIAAPADTTPLVPSSSAPADHTPDRPPALIFPRFSIPTLWNAWWCTSEAFEYPMRRLNEIGLLRQYTTKSSENVRYCRFKKVVSYIQSNMSDAMCELAPGPCFSTGWSKLSAYLMQKHGVIVKDDAAPSTLYDCCNKLGNAFKPPKWSAYQ
jgi:hypothetical protein